MAARLTTRILVFAKAPVPGEVKTRLIPALGADGAARLAARMLEQTLEAAAAAGVGPVELCTDAPLDPPPRPGSFAPQISLQGNGDLGERLSRAAKRVVEDVGDPLLLIGTDCPELDCIRLRAAAEALGDHDAVILPAADGGYVLLGLKRFDPLLFSDIAWSTNRVAAETIGRIRRLGWSLHVGETLRDVDEPDDLAWAGYAL